MDRLVQRNVLAMSGRAVEAAGDVNTLLLDKTGTITLGNRQASEFVPVAGIDAGQLATPRSWPAWPTRRRKGAASWCWPSRRTAAGAPRGRARRRGVRRVHRADADERYRPADGHQVRKGATNSVRAWISDNGGTPAPELGRLVEDISNAGGTPLVVAERVNAPPAPSA